jgi:putative ABC transport system substrate-binding protein
MRRRAFITFIGGAAAWPLAARGQQAGRVRRIGALMSASESDPEYKADWAAFREALQQLGWADNIQIEARWSAGDAARLQASAKELVAHQPELIFSQNTPTTAALLQHTRTIPIVFAQVVDPVGSGFVAGLPRPGGNVTGFLNLEGSMSGKWLELLKEVSPNVRKVLFLFNPATAPYASYFLEPFQAAAPLFRVQPVAAPVGHATELEALIAAQTREPGLGLMVMPDSYFLAHRADVIALAASNRLPAIYPFRAFSELGGLLSYGNDPLDNYRRAATYVDRILKGAKPSELPVQAPVKFELVINLKTARALDLDVPVQLQQRADEIIE